LWRHTVEKGCEMDFVGTKLFLQQMFLGAPNSDICGDKRIMYFREGKLTYLMNFY
jgi:hypothetical protein